MITITSNPPIMPLKVDVLGRVVLLIVDSEPLVVHQRLVLPWLPRECSEMWWNVMECDGVGVECGEMWCDDAITHIISDEVDISMTINRPRSSNCKNAENRSLIEQGVDCSSCYVLLLVVQQNPLVMARQQSSCVRTDVACWVLHRKNIFSRLWCTPVRGKPDRFTCR